MIKTSDIYWLAGLLEGEGCFSHIRNTEQILIQLSMTDADVVVRAAKLMGNRNVNTNFREGIKDFYRFTVYGNLAAQWMMTLYPLMGQRRKKRIEELLSIWRAFIPKLPGNTKIRKTEHENIKQRKLKGETSKSIAKDYNVQRQAIDKIIIRN